MQAFDDKGQELKNEFARAYGVPELDSQVIGARRGSRSSGGREPRLPVG